MYESGTQAGTFDEKRRSKSRATLPVKMGKYVLKNKNLFKILYVTPS
jgi:hypothetical protein